MGRGFAGWLRYVYSVKLDKLLVLKIVDRAEYVPSLAGYPLVEETLVHSMLNTSSSTP